MSSHLCSVSIQYNAANGYASADLTFSKLQHVSVWNEVHTIEQQLKEVGFGCIFTRDPGSCTVQVGHI